MSGCYGDFSINAMSEAEKIVSFTIEPATGKYLTNNTSVTINVNSLQDTPDEMAFFLTSNCTGAEVWEPYSATKAISLSTPDGAKPVSARLRTGILTTECQEIQITLDQTEPQSIAVSKNGGTTPTNNPVVTLTTTATDISPPVEIFIASDTSCTTGTWHNITSSVVHTLPAPTAGVDVTKEVYYKLRDAVPNESACAHYDINLDTIAPVVTVVIGDALVNASEASSVSLSGTCSEDGTNNVSIAAVSTGGGTFTTVTTNCVTGNWNYTANLSTLTSGTVTITAAQTDAAGNSGSDSDTLTLDKVAPTIAFANPAASSYMNATTSSAFTVDGTCSDNGTGNIAVTSSSTGGGSYTPTTADCASGFSQSLDLSTLTDGTVTVTLTISDAAGNTGTASRNFIKDIVSPTLTSVSIASGATYATTASVALTLTTAGTPTEYYATETAGCASGGSYAAIASPTFNLGTTPQGTRTVYVKVRDAAGNESACQSDSIILDSVVPTGTLVINNGDAETITQHVAVKLDTTDPDISQMYVFEGTCPTAAGTYVTYASRTNIVLANFSTASTDSATRNVSAWLKDTAGNTTCISDTDGILLYNTRNFLSFRSNGFRVLDSTSSVNVPIYLHDYVGTANTSISSALSIDYTVDDGTTLTKGTVNLPAGSSTANIPVTIPDVTTEKILKVNLYSSNKKNVPLQSLSQVALSVVDQAAANEVIGVMSGNSDTTCIIKGTNALHASTSSGKLWCWGEGSYKQIDGTSTDRLSPTAVDPTVDYADVSVGADHSCGIMTTGTPNLKCWGANDVGQLGRGTTDVSPPNGMTAITGAATWKSVTVGNKHTCAIDSSDKLWCWGDDTYGQLGNGATTGVQSTPVEVDSSVVTNSYSQVIAGYYHTCAIHSSKYVYCWGNNSNGQANPAAVGSNAVSPTRITIPGAVPATNPDLKVATSHRVWSREHRIGAGGAHSCAIASHDSSDNTDSNERGRLFCWGRNSSYESGNGSVITNITTPYRTANTIFYHVNLGDNTSCAITFNNTITSRTMRCFGNSDYGKIGVGTSSNSDMISIDRDIYSQNPTVAYNYTAPGFEHSCAVAVSTYNSSDDGAPLNQYSVRCAGRNSYGQLGLGAPSDETTPSPVDNFSGGNREYSKVAMGHRSGCALDTSNNLYCWGSSSFKLVGDGITNGSSSAYAYQRNTPIKIEYGVAYSKIAVGLENACGITSTGRLKCWGENSDGRMGMGNNDLASPVSINPSVNYSEVSVGADHMCAITSTGALHCWGNNTYGQIGDGTTAIKYGPTLIDSGTNYKFIAAGLTSTCGITTSDKLRCWGRNNAGQLGDTTYVNNPSPQNIDAAHDYLSVAVGQDHACAIRKATAMATQGAVVCWGNNDNGQVGINWGPGSSYSSPMQILDSSSTLITDEFTRISVGVDHSCGLRASDGKVFCWGYNSSGQLGDTTRTTRIYPVVTPVTAASDLSVSGDSSCAIEQSNGLMKCWGWDEFATLPLRRKLQVFQFTPGL
jgi:Alpha-tubulin suppressor and related RCC1 domain-containing proteins